MRRAETFAAGAREIERIYFVHRGLAHGFQDLVKIRKPGVDGGVPAFRTKRDDDGENYFSR